MGSANWGAFRGSPNHAANWMAPCFSVPSSEAGGHTQYQPKSGIFKSAVLDHFHIGADTPQGLNKSSCLLQPTQTI
jgi:hypothetical protein